ncbi:hypothetical protein LCGC14_1602200 [marine sediment metagenome]|uniref:Calcineurin-like phosphoesterase domain-containing protein n=1 Tax=marine sediment metagenome TaxID=412755 RepID=A0A0F9KRH2_9ZZZZ
MKKQIRYMEKAMRSAFDARLALTLREGKTAAEAAEILADVFPAYAITFSTVRHQAESRNLALQGTGGKSAAAKSPTSTEPETADAVIERERKRLRDAQLAKELRQLQRTEAKRQEYLEVVQDVLTPFKPSECVPIEGIDTARPEHFWTLLFSDWHVGQRTPIQTTGGIYEQTTEITKWQIDRMMKSFKAIHNVQIQGQDIRKLLIIFDGDLVENDSMRASQAHGIDRLVTQQAVEVYDLMGFVLRQFLSFPGIEEIEVHNVGGNHDRTSPKPGLAGLGELDYIDTYSWLVGTLLARSFEDEPRIKMTNWETFFGYTTFADRRIIFEHGSSFRLGSGSYGGVPWYPTTNAANKLIDMLGGGDLVLFGHLHRPAVVPLKQDAWLVVNGALPATTSYVQSAMKAVRTPTQWLINLHKEHGVVEFHPMYAPPPGLRKPGHVWQADEEV